MSTVAGTSGVVPTPSNWLDLTNSPSGTKNSASQSNTNTVDNLANENTFLKLLVAQLKNQDPQNPTDGTQFVSQLAQFSGLEQTMELKQDVESIGQTLNTLIAQSKTSSSGSSGTSGS